VKQGGVKCYVHMIVARQMYCIKIRRLLWGGSIAHETAICRRLRLKCDGTGVEIRFRLSAKRTSPFKSAGLQFSRLLAAEVCASAVVMLDTLCSEVVWRALATHSIRQFPLHFPSRASPCAITFQLVCKNPTPFCWKHKENLTTH